ncbi:hypothetical protein KQX54_000119 [Cotesia glomerata]|uniref:Uncharacterized protein n=1 Tax=Cotesia glomerata TaxID=32391 RepID=A0AAV7IXL5_COTGL|nr:hypothetical protein KQX54_000119 [Cotesia glomerata]
MINCLTTQLYAQTNQCKCQNTFSPISETQCKTQIIISTLVIKLLDWYDPWHYTGNADKMHETTNNDFNKIDQRVHPGLKVLLE